MADDVFEQLVIGDVVAGRLAHAAVTFATEAEHVDSQLRLHFPGYGVDVVADQPDRTGREDRDRLGMKQVVGLLDRLAELLFTAENDLFLLHVGGEAIGDEILVAGAWAAASGCGA